MVRPERRDIGYGFGRVRRPLTGRMVTKGSVSLSFTPNAEMRLHLLLLTILSNGLLEMAKRRCPLVQKEHRQALIDDSDDNESNEGGQEKRQHAMLLGIRIILIMGRLAVFRSLVFSTSQLSPYGEKTTPNS